MENTSTPSNTPQRSSEQRVRVDSRRAAVNSGGARVGEQEAWVGRKAATRARRTLSAAVGPTRLASVSVLTVELMPETLFLQRSLVGLQVAFYTFVN